MEWRQYRVMLYQAVTEHHRTNSSAPRGYSSNFIRVICKHMLWIKFMSASCEFVLSWIPPNTVDEKSTLVLTMTLCHQATGHLSQYSPDKCCIFFSNNRKKRKHFFSMVNFWFSCQFINSPPHDTAWSSVSTELEHIQDIRPPKWSANLDSAFQKDRCTKRLFCT